MTERFTDAIGKQAFVWFGWVFTVGGAVGSFVLGQAFTWIGWLAVLAGLLAVTSHAFVLHRRVRELESTNQKLLEQASIAEQRLNALSVSILEELAGIVSSSVSAQWVDALTQRVSLVERFRKFHQPDSKPLNPRTFAFEAGQLYAVVKVSSSEQAANLYEGDPFALFRKGSHGIEVKCARLRVHQPPDGGTVMFEVFDASGGEMTALRQLAQVRDVAGITGYFIKPEIDVSKYPEFSDSTINTILQLITTEAGNGTGGQP